MVLRELWRALSGAADAHPRLLAAAGTSCALGCLGLYVWRRNPARRKRMSSARDSLYVDAEAELTAKTLMAESEAHLPFALRVEHVETRFGRTQIMLVGPDRAPPLARPGSKR